MQQECDASQPPACSRRMFSGIWRSALAAMTFVAASFAKQPTADLPQEIDWTPGSPWRTKLDKAPTIDPSTLTFAPPAFGRDTLNPRGKEAERLGLLNSHKPKSMLTPMAMLAPSTSEGSTAMALPSGATLGLGEQDTPLLEEIAWGLNYDPVKIFNWIVTKVEFVPYYGLRQGAHVTALELRGNDYDQCVLLVSLLKQSGIPDSAITYVESDVNYSSSDIANWLSWDMNNASLALTGLGITNTSTSNGITIRRITVKAVVNGTTYWLDPAFKQVRRSNPVSVGQIVSSYSASSITSQAGGNAPSDDEYSGPAVDTFENTLSNVEAAYVRNASQNYHGVDARSLLGIAELNEPEHTSLTTALAQSNTTINTWSAIPTDRSLDLQLTLGTTSVTYHWCDLGNDVFNISFDSSGRASLYRETQLQITENGTPSGNFVVNGARIYPQNRTTPVPFSSTAMTRAGRTVIMPTFCNSQGRRADMAATQADVQAMYPNSDTALIHTLALVGLQREAHLDNSWCVGSAMANRLFYDDGSIWFYHGNGNNWYVDGPAVVYVSRQIRASSYTYPQMWTAMKPFSSATENICLEEVTATSASSTIAVFESALRNGTSLFRLTSSNYGSMSSRVSGGVDPSVQAWVQNSSNPGEAFVPSVSNVNIYNGGGLQCGGSLLCQYHTDYSDWPQWWSGTGWMISNGLNGASTSNATQTSTQASQQSASKKTDATADGQQVAASKDPVDLMTGAFLFNAPGLKVGNATEPLGLDLHIFYTTTLRLQNTAKLGNGWTHSYDMSAMERHGADIDLRSATVAEIAPMIVSMQYLLDTVTQNPSAKGIALEAMTAAWTGRQFHNSKVSVALGQRRLEFERLADSTYIESSSVPATLTKNADGSFVLAFRNANTLAFESGDGRITAITDPYGNTMSFTYTSGALYQVTDAFGRSLTFTYNASGLSSVVDSSGRSISFSPGTNFTITDPDGGSKTIQLNAQGELLNVIDEKNRTIVSNLYDPFHRVYAQQPLGDGAKTNYIGYAPGIAYEADAFGNRAWTTFDSRGRRVARRDALQNVSAWTYDGADNLLNETKPSGAMTQYTYDSADVLLSVIDSAGHTQTIQPDAQHRPQNVSDFNGKVTTYQYNDFTSSSNPSVTVYTTDLASITAPGGITASYTYYGNGLLKTAHPAAYAAGQQDSYAYDSYGNVQTITHPAAAPNVDTYRFDSLGNIQEFDDRNGAKETYGYNNRRLLTSGTQWNGATQYTSQASYDACGTISYSIDASGLRVDYDYDASGNLLTIKHGPISAQVTTLTNVFEDHRMLVHQATDALGNATTYAYDANGRLTDFYDPLNRHTQQFYDADSNPSSVITPLGFTTTTLYDGRGLVTGVKNAEGYTYNYEYDNNGRINLVQNRLSNFFTYTYDDDNRKVTLQTPMQRTGTSGFVTVMNARGLPASMTLPSGNVTTFDSYDNEGRLLQKTDGVAVTTYTYWPNGLIKTIAENNITTYRHYDALNRLDQYSDGYGNTIGYDYYPNGQLKDIVYPGGAKTVSYDYDSFGRLWHVIDGNRTTTYSYDVGSRLVRIDRFNGTYRKMAYDTAGELTSIEEHKSDGSIFSYESLSYDNDGRITSQSLYPKVAPFALPGDVLNYDVDNRLQTWNGQSIGFDANGNMTSGPLPSGTLAGYSYDARNRVTNAGGVGYVYNPDGFRVQVTGIGAATFIVDPNATLSRVLSRTKSGVTTYYVYGIGLLYEDTSGTTRQYHCDHLGNTVALSDVSQNITDQWTYSSYAAVNTRTGSTDTPFQANGELGVQTDANGLLFMRYRYYNPRLMRFVNADPSGFGGGLNWYGYCGNCPTQLVDPLGLCADGGDGITIPQNPDGSPVYRNGIRYLGVVSVPIHLSAGQIADRVVASMAPLQAGFNQRATGAQIATSESSGNSLKLVGAVGVAGTLGAMWGIAPGFFISGSVSLQGGIDLQRPLNSFIGVNYAYSPMIGMGFSATASTTYSGGLDWGETVTTGKAPTATTVHVEAGVQDGPTPYVTNAAVDFNKDGGAYARPGEGVGVDMHLAAGVTRTNAVNITVGDLINYWNLRYLGAKLPLVSPYNPGHNP